MPRRLLRSALYALYLAAFVLAVDYVFFWRPFVAELREVERPELDEIGAPPGSAVDRELMKHVGAMLLDRDSAFVHFAPREPPGAVRVCAFGDSYTYGDEVRPSQDFPTLLQGLLRADGAANVQVLNFGSSWQGLHQSYLMWERAGRAYGCDVALLGPGSFWPDRDTAFNHTQLLSPYYIHSRFVLDGEGVRLVAALGDTHRERFDAYFRFVPHWRYLRYDRNPPAALRALIPSGRRLRNPFYYSAASAAEEAAATWRVLLRRMAAGAPQVVLSHLRPEIVALARSLALPNLAAMPAFGDARFPYRMRLDHFSVLGNELVARQFRSALVAGAEAAAPVLESSDLDASLAGAPAPRHRPISEYRRLEVYLEDVRVGRFFTTSTDYWQRGTPVQRALDDAAVVSLLAVQPGGASLLDSAFVPLDFPLTQGAPVRLRGGGSETPLGHVRLLPAAARIGVVAIPEVAFRDKQELVLRADAGRFAGRGAAPTLMVGETPVLRAERRGGELILAPARGRLVQLAAAGNPGLDLGALGDAGSFDLVLAHPEDGPARIPLARWRKRAVPLPQPRAPVARRLHLAADGTAALR